MASTKQQWDEIESDDELGVDAFIEAEQMALGKLRNDELRKQDEDRKRKLMDDWSASASAKREEKKKAEAAAAEELKDEAKLLAKERQLQEEISRLKKEQIRAETDLNTVTSALRELQKKHPNPEMQKRMELAARIRRSILKTQEFRQRRLSESVAVPENNDALNNSI